MLTPLGLALVKLVVMGLIGVPVAAMVDPSRRLFYLVGGRSEEFIATAYVWSWYAVGVLVLLGLALGLNRRLQAYQRRPVVGWARSEYLRLWIVAFAGAVACAGILFVQSGFQHPGLSAWGLSELDVAQRRIDLWQNLNMNVYNLGVQLCAALALTVSGMFLRSWRLFLASLVLFGVLVTFSLAKSPIADTVVELAFVYLVLRRPSWRIVPVVAVAVLGALGLMAWVTRWAGDWVGFWRALAIRVIWGQVADLPHYFNLFSTWHVPFVALLPPYVQTLLGTSEPSAARLVMEFSNPLAVKAGVAGVANTLFVGEAYAFAGVAGVLFSPLLVAVQYAVVIWLFGVLRKDVVTVFLFGYLLDRMTAALFGGVSSFVFSAMHVVLGGLLAVVLLQFAMPHRGREVASA